MVVIAPTTVCNMSCPYCFEKDVVSPKTMSKDIYDSVVEYVKSISRGKDITVIWYGGEPLLSFNTIKELSIKLIDYANSVGKKYNAAMVTNGFLLTPDVADVLYKQCDVSLLQITIDGLKNSHDKRRGLKDGRDTFQTIIENIDYCKNFLKISLRLNIDKQNILEMVELLNWLSKDKKDWVNNVIPYVAPVTKVHDGINYNETLTREEFGSVFDENYIEHFIKNQRYQKGIIEEDSEYFLDNACALERKAWRGLFPYSYTNPCGAAGKDLIVIDPEGYLYKCWDTVGLKKHVVGDIFKGFYNNEFVEKWDLHRLPQKCCDCNYLPVCLGGCPRECIFNDNTPSCPQDLQYYKDIVIEYYENWKIDKKNKKNNSIL